MRDPTTPRSQASGLSCQRAAMTFLWYSTPFPCRHPCVRPPGRRVPSLRCYPPDSAKVESSTQASRAGVGTLVSRGLSNGQKDKDQATRANEQTNKRTGMTVRTHERTPYAPPADINLTNEEQGPPDQRPSSQRGFLLGGVCVVFTRPRHFYLCVIISRCKIRTRVACACAYKLT